MYLHIGGEVIVPVREIVAIINLNHAKGSAATKEFMQLAQTEKKIVQINQGSEAKACVITQEKIYLSSISSLTLGRRTKNTNFEGE